MPTTSNFGWTTPADTDLVKNGALAIRTLGNGIDTSMAELKGGTTGQVLSKASNTDMDFTWTTDASGISPTIVDAKGDLIAASAADTPARLAVGNNGETLVADSSQTTGLRYNPPVGSLANPIINGGMDIWQRGTSGFVPANNTTGFSADRWQIYRAVAGSTVSRQTTSDTTNLPNIQYSLRAQRNSGNTATDQIWVAQSIETMNSIPYAGKTVTVSFYARAGANFSGSNLSAELYSGTGTDQNIVGVWTGQTTVASGTPSITTTWTRYVITGTIATTATELAVLFRYTPSGTAGANDWFELTGVQIDVGTWTASTAPTFRRSGGTLAGELAACQRYYYRATANANYAMMAHGQASSSTLAAIAVRLPVTMRSAPTVVDYSTLRLSDESAGYAVTNLTVNTNCYSKDIPVVDATVASGLTAQRYFSLQANNSTSAYLGLAAEL